MALDYKAVKDLYFKIKGAACPVHGTEHLTIVPECQCVQCAYKCEHFRRCTCARDE
jgi:hypothetical protein